MDTGKSAKIFAIHTAREFPMPSFFNGLLLARPKASLHRAKNHLFSRLLISYANAKKPISPWVIFDNWCSRFIEEYYHIFGRHKCSLLFSNTEKILDCADQQMVRFMTLLCRSFCQRSENRQIQSCHRHPNRISRHTAHRRDLIQTGLQRAKSHSNQLAHRH